MSRSGWVWRQLCWREPASIDAAVGMLEHLATSPGLGPVAVELRAGHGEAVWLVGAGPEAIDDVTRLAGVHLPVVCRPLDRPACLPGAAARLRATGGSLATHQEQVEVCGRSLQAALAGLAGGEEVVLQTLLGPRQLPPVVPRESFGSLCLRFLTGTPPADPSGRHSVRREPETSHGFAVAVRLGLTAATSGRCHRLGDAVLAALRLLETTTGHLRLVAESPGRLQAVTVPWRWPLVLTSTELAALTGWPVGAGSALLGPVHPARLAPVVAPVPAGRLLGRVVAPGVQQPAGLPIGDGLFHTHLLGPTGVGKSTLMLHLISADLAAGRGVLLLDPKGDLAGDTLARIPAGRRDDVVVIDPTSPTPVGFNPLHGPAGQTGLTADTLLATFEHLFARTWGIRSADIFHASFLTLAHLPEATLLWLAPLLTDPGFRRRVLARVDDPIGVGGFWNQFNAKSPAQQGEEIAPVLNKLRQLILRPGLRAVLGQARPRFDVAELFTDHRIVIVNLNRGRLGAEAARLLGSLLIGQLWGRILARQATSPAQRRIVSVYIDEVQDFLAGIPGDLADALALSRSLGVALTLAHQYLSQLSPAMRAAVETNTRNKIYFTLAASDAASAARQAPGLQAADFQALPPYHAYANLMHTGRPTGWFMLATSPAPPALVKAGEIAAVSHQRFGVSAADTDRAIRALTQPWTTKDSGPAEGPVGRKQR